MLSFLLEEDTEQVDEKSSFILPAKYCFSLIKKKLEKTRYLRIVPYFRVSVDAVYTYSNHEVWMEEEQFIVKQCITFAAGLVYNLSMDAGDAVHWNTGCTLPWEETVRPLLLIPS